MRELKILVADNNPTFLKIVTETLERQGKGYRVIQASAPEQAERILAERNVDLVVLDVRLRDDHDNHDYSGLEIARRFYEFIPTIVMTMNKEIPWPLTDGIQMVSKDDPSLRRLLQEIRKAIIPHVFIVHGRNHGPRDRVARYVEQLGMKSRILEEQGYAGRSILQNFEREAGLADFAIVLLTGDERCCVGDSPDSVLRARPNVIFELGYFIATLGSDRVVALHEPLVEIPSDYSGILYRHMDEPGAWKQALRSDLANAGLDPALYEKT